MIISYYIGTSVVGERRNTFSFSQKFWQRGSTKKTSRRKAIVPIANPLPPKKDARVPTAKLFDYKMKFFDCTTYNIFVRFHWFCHEPRRREEHKKLSIDCRWSRFILITILYSLRRLSRSLRELLRILTRGKHKTLYSQVSIFNRFPE